MCLCPALTLSKKIQLVSQSIGSPFMLTLSASDIGIIADDLTGACDVAACFAAGDASLDGGGRLHGWCISWKRDFWGHRAKSV